MKIKPVLLGLAAILAIVVLAIFEPWARHPTYTPSANASQERGSVESVEYLEGYSKWQLRGLIKFAGLPNPIPVENGIELYRINYWTEHLGKPILVSGLYALPRGLAPAATVMWSHGTSVERAFAPSTPTLEEGVLIAATYSGSGFVTIAPDMMGLGQSKTHHPYFYMPTTIAASMDMLKAARTVSERLKIDWKPSLYLAGFSQGGLTTAAVQRTLEANPDPAFVVKASAAMAPPLNLAEISFPNALAGPSSASSLYAAYIVSSYSQVYNKPANSILLDKYADMLPKLYSGDMTADAVVAALPKETRTMFRPEFLAGFEKREPSWFRDALVASEGYGWSPKAPLRLYVGSKDTDVPAEDARTSAAKMKAGGGNVTMIEVGAYTHEELVVHAVPQSQAWFKALNQASGANAVSAARPNPICDEVTGKAKTYLKETGTPGIAMGVVKNGQVVCAIALGVTDFKSKAPMTPDTNFHLASVSKSFTAVAVMQLVSAKKLDLDAPITRSVPYFKMADPRYQQITLRQLLNHRSGIGDVEDYGWDKPQTDDAALSRYVRSLESEKLLSAPGARFSYSNIAYEIIGAAIEHVSGVSFEAYMAKEIFSKAGMTGTSFLYPAPGSLSQARPHILNEAGVHEESSVYPFSRAHGPSSTLESNVNDMNRWMVAALSNPSPLLSQGDWRQLWTQGPEAIDLDGDPLVLPGGRIGLGWFSGREFGENTVLHPGQDTGFKAMLMLNPTKNIGVVMMTNSDGPEPGGEKADFYFGTSLSRFVFDTLGK
jgi:CubicO group peptidase (beta-lactamase class C family)/pimeloyl-ACP methyl ester carboxylesterase